MRILLETKDPQTERNYLQAADMRNRQRLIVLHSEAQVSERLFRDPFDTLILDDADAQSPWLSVCRRTHAGNLVLLFRDPVEITHLPDGVTYAFLRSYEPAEVLRRIESFPKHKDRPERTEALISASLQRTGIPVHLKGFSLLKNAIRLMLSVDRPTEIRMIDGIYEALALSDGCSVTQIEHAMRHAIEAAWLRADVRELEALFGYTVSPDRAAPSNAGFLFTVTDRIKAIHRRNAS